MKVSFTHLIAWAIVAYSRRRKSGYPTQTRYIWNSFNIKDKNSGHKQKTPRWSYCIYGVGFTGLPFTRNSKCSFGELASVSPISAIF